MQFIIRLPQRICIQDETLPGLVGVHIGHGLHDLAGGGVDLVPEGGAEDLPGGHAGVRLLLDEVQEPLGVHREVLRLA